MTEYIAECRHNENDRILARVDGSSVELVMRPGDEYAGESYLSASDARTFARGILALADVVDGGEAATTPTGARPVQVGDTVRVLRATYGELTHGRVGTVTSTSGGFRAWEGDPHPYDVEFADGDCVHAAEVELVEAAPLADWERELLEDADPQPTPSPFARYVEEAKRLLTGTDHTGADVIVLARELHEAA
jgi:hypothetical protein